MKYSKMTLAALVVFTSVLATAMEPFVEVISVVPNKILYNDNEPGTAKVRLANPFQHEVAVTLQPTLLWDLEETLTLHPVTVTVPANGNADTEVSWPAVRQRWGHEIRVEAMVDGEVVDRGRQFFGVNSDWMDMILISFRRLHQNLLETVLGPFHHYSTVSHHFAWAPGDYTENAPEYDEWWSGQTGYHMKKDELLKNIREAKEWGMRVTFYNNAFSNGKAGLEWARRHPQWVVRRRSGEPMLHGSALALTKPYADKTTGQMGYVQIDFQDEEVIRWGARNVIESVKMFGWDGMFWDCGGPALFPGFSYDGQPTPHGQEPDELSARNYRLFHETVRREFPYFGVWINGGFEGWRQPFWSQFGNSGGMLTAREQFSTPSTGLLIEFRHHERPGGKFNNWQYCHDAYVQERDAVTQSWGAPVIAGYTTPWNWRAESHLGALLLASQIRPANCHQEGTWPMTQFMTRYSSILWRRDIKVVPDPHKVLAVEMSRPVWWDRFVYRRPRENGEDLMLHLVAVPETETVVTDHEGNPPETRGTVTLDVPAGQRIRKIFALQPRIYHPGVDGAVGIGLDVGGPPAVEVREIDPADPEGRRRILVHRRGSLVRGGPTQVELDYTMHNGKATVELPDFIYHAMLVFRLESAQGAQ